MTQLELINLAMDELGESPITSTADTSDRALVAVRQWERTLRAFLREFQWPWAKTTTELSAASPVPAFGWDARYPLPDDFISLVSLNEETTQFPSDAFEIQSGYLFTDATEAQIEYVYFPTSTELDTFLERMDGQASDAFILLLASNMAMPIAKDGGEKTVMLKRRYAIALSAARTRAGNEQKLDRREPAAESMFIRARSSDMAG